MSKLEVHTIDLNFQGKPSAIAAYLISYSDGGILIECGPGSTIQNLTTGIKQYGFEWTDITDLLVTHIHLDHAGAAGWIAQKGINVHVHPVGAPHLENPEKLLASATRIYGSQMDILWGEFLPVPKNKLMIHQDGDRISIGPLKILAVDTPGHATHHFAYLLEEYCFSGDIGGVRMPGTMHVRVPMPPPEFNLEQWRESVSKLRRFDFDKIIPTHFGIYDDPGLHLDALERELDAIEAWMVAYMPTNPSLEAVQDEITEWARKRSLNAEISQNTINLFELANPTWMSAAGIFRYWKKHRQTA